MPTNGKFRLKMIKCENNSKMMMTIVLGLQYITFAMNFLKILLIKKCSSHILATFILQKSIKIVIKLNHVCIGERAYLWMVYWICRFQLVRRIKSIIFMEFIVKIIMLRMIFPLNMCVFKNLNWKLKNTRNGGYIC